MLSLLVRSALQSRPSFFIPTALAIATAGRAHYSSTTGPEWKPTHQHVNKSNECRARRSATDPEYRESLRDKHRRYMSQNRDKIRARVAARKESHDYEKLYYAPSRARWASDDHHRRSECLRDWVTKNLWVRELTWPTHRPMYSEKTIHYCGGCEATKPLKLWWQDKKTDEFLCHPCFTSDWSRALPNGYEDKVFGGLRGKGSRSKDPTNGGRSGPKA